MAQGVVQPEARHRLLAGDEVNMLSFLIPWGNRPTRRLRPQNTKRQRRRKGRLTGGSRGGAMTSANGEGRLLLLWNQHDQEIRTTLIHENRVRFKPAT
jgi:hypothetical protein